MDIPRDKSYPVTGSVQCDGCGGTGCGVCDNKGWLVPRDHPRGRRCAYEKCNNPLHPRHYQIYCSNECAHADA